MGAYTEMLLPNNILKPESVIGRLVKDIPEEDFRDAVQIIGWLYQYYITELNEIVYDGTFSKERIPKELLSAATTIYTPDWAIRYMVDNSLGKMFVGKHPQLKTQLKYYLDGETVESNVFVEDVRLLDPCMGSGHILVYAFDVFMQIYRVEGYSERDAAKLILEKNIHGLDIDKRAYQLAYFALMMKARQYNRRILNGEVKPQVYCPAGYVDGEEYGSIMKISELEPKPEESEESQLTLFDESFAMKLNTWNFRRILSQRYDVVVTNPPYLGSGRFSPKILEYVNSNYPEVKSDLSMVMYKHALQDLSKKNGYVAFITTSSWMFLSSFEKFRTYVLNNFDFDSLVDFGSELFDGKVGHNLIVAWVNRNSRTHKKMTAIRLVDYCYSRRNEKESEFFNPANRYIADAENFAKIPGNPVAYWVSEKMLKAFEVGRPINDVSQPRQGLATADNNRFLRLWHEIAIDKCGFNLSQDEAKESGMKWFPYNKGGGFRKWYGNNDYVVNWENDGFEIRNFSDGKGYIRSRAQNTSFYFRPSVTWTLISSSATAFRYKPQGHLFDVAGMSMFPSKDNLSYILGFCNTSIAYEMLRLLAPTLNFQVGDIARLPIISEDNKQADIEKIVVQNIETSKIDWDSFEESWNFKKHPLISGERTVAAAFGKWEREAAKRFDTLKANEEELNRIFINIYGLEDELTPEVKNKDVTLKTNTAYRYKQKKKKSNDDEFEMQEEIVESEEIRDAKFLRDTICEFISYSVGCMFGRYSLGCEGLAFAGGEWDAGKYQMFPADKDNILPICDDEYFDDDIAGRFVNFVKTVYGADTLEENLKFIADALGGKGTPREVIRNYFLNDFYKDHCKIYQKRPIYWLFDSGKKNGFKALIYMHRYSRDLLAKLRTDYVHEQQERYRTQLSHIAGALNTATGAERARLLKQQDKLSEQAREIGAYEEKVHHLADMNITIDLDDGVKKNYEIFADILAKI